jgi:formylglycine-generating enzyme required for sulfatase activity/uncharacterized caspase-like protein
MSDNWAICIGINRYDNLKPLEYAQRDAEAMSGFFNTSARFKRVYLLAEDAPSLPSDFGNPLQARPTFGNLMRFLRVRFDERFLDPSDTLWFFFAGHGRRDRDQDYLLPIDADPGDVEKTAIPVRHVAERLRRSGANNIVLLLDACRNEGARGGEGLGLDRQQGAVTICSCSPSEFSYEIAELGHGAFTHGLLEALRMEGGQNCATVERLDSYLMSRVPEICREYGKPRQTPSTFLEPLSKRHLILLPARALPDDLDPLKIEALDAETKGDLKEAEQLWRRIIAVAPGDAKVMEALKRVWEKQKEEDDRRAALNERQPQFPTPEKQPSLRDSEKERKAKDGLRGWISRRSLLSKAAATASVAVAATGGILAYPYLTGSPRTETRSEIVPVTTVNAMGVVITTEIETIKVFGLPVGADDTVDFSILPAGRFVMGSPMDEPLRINDNEERVPIDIASIAFSRTTITQGLWRAVILAHRQEIDVPLSSDPSSFRGDDERPVETVNWLQAMEFCARLSALTERTIRLPSEAEWEYACRAGTETAFHFGPTLTPALANYCGAGGAVCGTSFGKDIANLDYRGSSYPNGAYADGPVGKFDGSTKRVRSYPANRFGLFQMHGNVWEHCLDHWSASLMAIPRDGQPFQSNDDQHVIRGGSFSHNPALCRSAYRDYMEETNHGWEGRVGFRVVCEL